MPLRLFLLALAAALPGCPGDEPLCNPTTCPGCCQGTVCYEQQQCGVRGDVCSSVCRSTEVCDFTAGKCVPRCRAENCDTCCLADGTCAPKQTSKACGQHGAACVDCGDDRYCDFDLGECAVGCNAESCPSGCCQDGVCQPGNTVSACGKAGQECAKCGSGQTCSFFQCQTTCGPSNCSGCCQSNVCLSGTTSDGCGTGGAHCSICTGSATCQSHACTCPSGTCLGNDMGCHSGCPGTSSCDSWPLPSAAVCMYLSNRVYCCVGTTNCLPLGADCTSSTLACCAQGICAGKAGAFSCMQRCWKHSDCATNCCAKLKDSEEAVCSAASVCD